MKTPDPLIAALDAERIRQDLTMEGLSVAAGLSKTAWIVVLNRQAANLNTLQRVAAALGLTLDARRLRPHGTPAAVARHRYHGERLCGPCLRWDRDRKRATRDVA